MEQNLRISIGSQDSPNQYFWLHFIDHVKKAVPNAIVTVMRDEDVHDGHIFNTDNNKTNAYDILLLFHNEYVTQNQYNNLKQFVSNGGTIVLLIPTYSMQKFAMTEIIIQ
jgi:hypothetical protein